ncbi:MAG: hypothetical protein GEV09_22120 [Pseudonocardiaceae bacterium]|nr:hypothetical protein [Pseudonocardiaceae bacterium]
MIEPTDSSASRLAAALRAQATSATGSGQRPPNTAPRPPVRAWAVLTGAVLLGVLAGVLAGVVSLL